MKRIGRKPKIDKRKLHHMLRMGKSQTECAKHFNVSPSAVNQAKKNLTLGITKNICLENGSAIVEKNIDALSELIKINKHTNSLVDLLSRWIEGDQDAIETLKRHHLLGGIGGKKNASALSFRDPKEILLRAVAEVRGQVKLSLQIHESLYNMRTVQEFQVEVLNVIGQQHPEVRNEIVRRLKQRRAIRSSVRIA